MFNNFKLSIFRYREFLVVLSVLIFFFTITFYKLDDLPGEWYGDISIVHEYTEGILAGNFPFHFALSAGPLYHYAISPIVFLLTPSYLTYKISSVIIGAVGLIGIYLLARELMGKKVALITILVSSCSFWYIAWSRLGNSQIIIPLFTSLAVYFFLRFEKTKKIRFFIISAIISFSGFFVYPHTFILPVLFFLFLFLSPAKNKKKLFAFSGVIFLYFLVIFINIVLSQRYNFLEGYLGTKIFNYAGLSVSEIFMRFFNNVIKTALMFHIKGDVVFRTNIPYAPHLDKISGLFLLIGTFCFMRKSYRRISIFLFLPILVLIIPSLWPLLPPAEIPNMSRTIGITPFIFIIISAGIYWIFHLIKDHARYLSYAYLILAISNIGLINIHQYFAKYPFVLPNDNIGISKQIARFIDTHDSNHSVFLKDCCWGEWTHPDIKSIKYSLKSEKRVTEIVGCKNITSFPAIVISMPNEKWENFKMCFPEAIYEKHVVNNTVVFSSLTISEEL